METNQLEVLARFVLPSEMLDYFEMVGVEQTSTKVHERMNPSLVLSLHYGGLITVSLCDDAGWQHGCLFALCMLFIFGCTAVV